MSNIILSGDDIREEECTFVVFQEGIYKGDKLIGYFTLTTDGDFEYVTANVLLYNEPFFFKLRDSAVIDTIEPNSTMRDDEVGSVVIRGRMRQ